MGIIRPIARTVAMSTADFFTGSYRFSASLITNNRSVKEVLSDRQLEYLNLVDIYISRINTPGDIIATYPRGVLVKEEVNFIVLSSEIDGSKERAHLPSQIFLPVFLTLPTFEVEGKFQWQGGLDAKRILATDLQQFLPVLDATVRNAFLPTVHFESPMVLVNKTKIQIICTSDAS